ncbi:MAG: ketoacyl-ACP synthase III [Balneolales bacterium]|nr:ketoacyl-ACP synthase III [Balneolales bacterium]
MSKPFAKRNARIVATGHYVPERVVPNSYFNDILGEDVDTWLQENLTIRERRWMTEDQTTSDLCVYALLEALSQADMCPEEIDLLIISTDTPDFISPSTASVVCHKAGLTNAASFDLNTACAGFVTALETGTNYIKANEDYTNVMVIGAYGMSRFLNLHDKKTVTLFADGAAAAILTATTDENAGHIASSIKTRGEYHGYMGIYGGATAHPASCELVNENGHQLQFVKKFPKELNPQMWTEMITEVAQKGGFSVDEIQKAFMTQININQIWETMDNLKLPRETAPTIMSTYGYTGSAAIGMALDISNRSGALNRGDVLVFMGSGGGLTFACNAFRW